MFDVILATTKKFGIGFKNNMPFYDKDELAIFKQKTNGNVLIMGRKTIETLPFLENRIIYGVTKNPELSDSLQINNKVIFLPNIMEAVDYALKNHPYKKIFIAGGSEIYNEVFRQYGDHIDKIHISIMNDENIICDKFINFSYRNCTILEQHETSTFKHYVLGINSFGENQYLNVLENVFEKGLIKKGRNGYTKSTFTEHMKFDLTKGFPLVTTRKMFIRGIIEELLFFLRGETDSKILEEKGIKIWSGNTSREFLDSINKTDMKEGLLGEMYGYQFRYFDAPYDKQTGKPISDDNGLDQFSNLINGIIRDPYSRRHLMTSYNPKQAENGCLYPCHSLMIQIYIEDNFMDMFCFNRSGDLFHGIPFNIASSALLLHIICKITNYTPRFLNITVGDAHIYESHFKHAVLQLDRIAIKLPTIFINKEITLTNFHELKYEDFVLENYISHPAIKADMVV